MNTIWEWLERLDAAGLLQLLEAAAYFDPAEYNAVFEKELDDLLERTDNDEARQQILALQGFDFSNYLLNSLKRAGIRGEDEQQEYFHEIAVRLLVSPGKLFHWNPEEHGPLGSSLQIIGLECNQEHREKRKESAEMDAKRRSCGDCRENARARIPKSRDH